MKRLLQIPGTTFKWPELAAYTAEKLSGADSSHDLDHTVRVVCNASRLLEQLPDADRTIVKLAALLHDIGRPEEYASNGKLCHAETGAALAGALLAKYNFPEAITARVTRAISQHRFRRGAAPDTLEAQILFDADKLDSLGAVGLGRAFLFAGSCGARLHNSETEALNSEAYSKEDTAYREYLVKLRHLPEKMFTEYGKSLARERLQYMQEFFARLEAEITP